MTTCMLAPAWAYRRFAKYADKTVRSVMAEETIRLVHSRRGLDSSVYPRLCSFPETVLGDVLQSALHSSRQVILRGMHIDKIPVTNVENACAGDRRPCTWRTPA